MDMVQYKKILRILPVIMLGLLLALSPPSKHPLREVTWMVRQVAKEEPTPTYSIMNLMEMVYV